MYTLCVDQTTHSMVTNYIPQAYDGTKINIACWEYDFHLGYNVKRNMDVKGELPVNVIQQIEKTYGCEVCGVMIIRKASLTRNCSYN